LLLSMQTWPMSAACKLDPLAVSVCRAGVGVGSAVGMMAMAMDEEEKKQAGTAAVAHSVVEARRPAAATRGFAASQQ
jgi:hypothetical protein